MLAHGQMTFRPTRPDSTGVRAIVELRFGLERVSARYLDRHELLEFTALVH
jgi:hypothetical protein